MIIWMPIAVKERSLCEKKITGQWSAVPSFCVLAGGFTSLSLADHNTLRYL